MTDMLLYIFWDPSPVLAHIGPLALRWYGLAWLVGLLLGYVLMSRLYREQRIGQDKFEPLFIYVFLAALVGARLVHCLVYDRAYFLSSWITVLEIFVPMRHTASGWHFVGYEGLASHGGVLALILALCLYVRRYKVGLWVVLDNMGICAGVTAMFIRLGNLMNSEIIGRVTDVPWAFIFSRVDPYPRHPGQLYEALAYLFIFCLIYGIYRRRGAESVGRGFYFGLCLTTIFVARFFIEFTKEVQVDYENQLPLNLGQLLSIPFVLIGVATMVGGRWMGRIATWVEGKR